MNYRVQFEGKALVQLNALPLLTFHVENLAELIRTFDIAWVG